MSLSGKRVIVLGGGASGRAAAVLALREGADVAVYDGAAELSNLPEGATARPGLDESTPAENCDLLVVSPGIDTYGPLVKRFAASAGEVIGEIELAIRYYKGRIIAVTGTNGKTTTTELVERILRAGGLDAVACGNYGPPACAEVVKDPQPAALSLEVSSFQLETIVKFRPEVAVWLNFAPDHQDRYPDIESYRRAKLRIFENQTPEDTAVVRYGEAFPTPAARVVTFSTESREADWYSEGRFIERRGEMVLDLEAQSHLRGLHNAENAMAAMAACSAFGLPLAAMRAAFDGYAPPRHRCELVRTLDGVEWLNDSKATNLHALECALRSQSRPVVLIAGGKDKGLDYRPVLPLLEKKAVAAVVFGQIGGTLEKLFEQRIRTERRETLAEAVGAAHRLAPAGGCVLFSPGTSSFDQFEGYADRGDRFCELVLNLS